MTPLAQSWLDKAAELEIKLKATPYGTRSRPQIIREIEVLRRCASELPSVQYNDAVRIARGCLDYGGGYRSNDGRLEAFHHGIQTVINALEAGSKGLGDSQVAALHMMGGGK